MIIKCNIARNVVMVVRVVVVVVVVVRAEGKAEAKEAIVDYKSSSSPSSPSHLCPASKRNHS